MSSEAVPKLEPEMAAVAGVQHGDVVTDVMADDDPIFEIDQELAQRFGFFQAGFGLVAGDAVDRHRCKIMSDRHQDFEGVSEQDLLIDDRHGAEGDEPVAPGVETRGLRIEHHETNLLHGCLVGPGAIEASEVLRHHGQWIGSGHRSRIESKLAEVSSSTSSTVRKQPLSTCWS